MDLVQCISPSDENETDDDEEKKRGGFSGTLERGWDTINMPDSMSNSKKFGFVVSIASLHKKDQTLLTLLPQLNDLSGFF